MRSRNHAALPHFSRGPAGPEVRELRVTSMVSYFASKNSYPVAFPRSPVCPGQFLLKDVGLLGAAIWSFGEPWTSR